MGQIILLAVALRFFTRHIFQYEKISRLEMVIVPAYTLIMGCVLIIKRPPALLPLVLTVVIGALVGWFQATGLVLQVTDEQDENQRPIVKARRNWQYLLGWIVIFAYGILFAWWSGERVSIMGELTDELVKDLFVFKNFSQAASWNIMLQSAVASIVYIMLAIRKEPRVWAAIAHQEKTKSN
ncbi:hydrophobic protein [Schleiferilactobacillus harbinensis]|jgi:hypothetical protein|uniref:hypothetical protein n=1 Tax=Schleiferilactobacillus harbinensis TaxID=304207 RepID=UPI0007BA18BC|nr:hypothetical protein [Schleiferilactobacillus harbinensis]MBO3090634.1 hydrophobic protein [Schleiferilactobacillus harbinensis]